MQYNSVPRTTGATSHRPQFSGNLLLRLPLQFDPCVVRDFNLGHTSCRCHPVSHVCAPDHAHLCRRERTYSRQWLGATGFKVFSAVSNAQGPNYALAKMIQRWRAICAHEVDGQLVSINVAPGARTYSVMHASQVAAVLNKIHYFAPNEFYEPATVRRPPQPLDRWLIMMMEMTEMMEMMEMMMEMIMMMMMEMMEMMMVVMVWW